MLFFKLKLSWIKIAEMMTFYEVYYLQRRSGKCKQMKDKVSKKCSHEIRSVPVDDGTEGQSISEGWSHVCNVHITVTFTLVPAPVLQSFQRAHGRDSKIHTYSLVLLLQYTRRPKSSWETLFHMSLSGTVRSCCLNFKRSHSTKVSSTDLTVDYSKEEDKKNQHTRVKLQLQLKA